MPFSVKELCIKSVKMETFPKDCPLKYKSVFNREKWKLQPESVETLGYWQSPAEQRLTNKERQINTAKYIGKSQKAP